MHDLVIQAVFYCFAALALVSAFMVVTLGNPVRCVLFLVLTFFAVSGLWVLANAEFLALILVLVYVGAVMTLFLFVVMMLNIDTATLESQAVRYLPFGLVVVAVLAVLLLKVVPNDWYQTSVEQSMLHTTKASLLAVSNTEAIGLAIFTEYVFAFELAAVLLLIAIIAAITLAHRNIVRSKRQNINQQLMTRAKDRITLVTLTRKGNDTSE